MRTKVESNICGQRNSYGFLTGSVNDYLDRFDTQVRKISQQLERDKSHWEKQTTKMSNKQKVQTVKYEQIIEKYQRISDSSPPPEAHRARKPAQPMRELSSSLNPEILDRREGLPSALV